MQAHIGGFFLQLQNRLADHTVIIAGVSFRKYGMPAFVNNVDVRQRIKNARENALQLFAADVFGLLFQVIEYPAVSPGIIMIKGQ